MLIKKPTTRKQLNRIDRAALEMGDRIIKEADASMKTIR